LLRVPGFLIERDRLVKCPDAALKNSAIPAVGLLQSSHYQVGREWTLYYSPCLQDFANLASGFTAGGDRFTYQITS